ncbi:helix-turn-helix domain-containing protein [Mucilaginibacter jinjuensis]|uniref:Helix-turn-helix domain-containing protein n=1 Tax=Mucilaginibacter jinjuensis TaxID=1176721 RepID=A0ABY7TEK6_9SPHI|nr:helix-turn-helix domain-containing protein [Mucilaginibacter jinjuensis]WCT14793.1 helix-turn-helix domain-containing protein [Mucilaginibacter jinjuensis]
MKKAENIYQNVLADRDLKDSFSVSYWDDKYFDNQAFRSTYNRIFLIECGHGNVQIDDAIHSIQTNELLLLAKGQLYQFLPGSHLTGYELIFGDCFWERTPASASNCKAVLFNNASANQQIPVAEANLPELLSLFNTLYQEFLTEDYINKPDALAAYLKIIMIKIANLNALLINGFDSHENQLYRQFLELVSKQYQSTHEVADFANQLGITARKLSDLCNRCAGKGAKDIINGQLVAEAKRSLQFSAKPVKEIAFHLNFSTPDQFSHFFKKNTQISPNQYRSNFVNIGM